MLNRKQNETRKRANSKPKPKSTNTTNRKEKNNQVLNAFFVPLELIRTEQNTRQEKQFITKKEGRRKQESKSRTKEQIINTKRNKRKTKSTNAKQIAFATVSRLAPTS